MTKLNWAACSSLALWFLIFLSGKHPDFTWGDGLGYVNAVESGYDLATNANSHFTYLNFSRILFQVFGLKDAMSLMGNISIVSSVLFLFILFQVSKYWKSEFSGFISIQIMACCFTFWRHACTIEVYNFALIFWALMLFGVLKYLKKSSSHGLWIIAVSFSIGILTHIQFVLSVPALIWLFYFKRPASWIPFMLLLFPIFSIFYSVWILELNDFQSVFFDSVGGKMLSPGFWNVIKGPFFITALTFFLNPALFLLGIFKLEIIKSWKSNILNDQFLQFILILAAGVFTFASLYPEAGIHVFLLPFFMILALLAGSVFSNVPGFILLAISYPIVQIGLFYTFKFGYDEMKKSNPDPVLKWKGGSGYIFLPWAKGNASSILKLAESYPIDSIPDVLQWNFKQAKSRILKPNPIQK